MGIEIQDPITIELSNSSLKLAHTKEVALVSESALSMLHFLSGMFEARTRKETGSEKPVAWITKHYLREMH